LVQSKYPHDRTDRVLALSSRSVLAGL